MSDDDEPDRAQLERELAEDEAEVARRCERGVVPPRGSGQPHTCVGRGGRQPHGRSRR